MTCMIAQRNVPMSLADTLSPLVRSIFSDSPTAKGYSCSRTKSTCIINNALAEEIREKVVKAIQKEPYSLAIDGSTDRNDDKKLNPLTVRFVDPDSRKNVFQLLDMCLTMVKKLGRQL